MKLVLLIIVLTMAIFSCKEEECATCTNIETWTTIPPGFSSVDTHFYDYCGDVLEDYDGKVRIDTYRLGQGTDTTKAIIDSRFTCDR